MLLCPGCAGAPVRLPVQDVFKGRTGGTCVGGKLEAGALKSGSKVLVVPGYVTATVKGLEVNSQVCVGDRQSNLSRGVTVRGDWQHQPSHGCFAVLLLRTGPVLLIIDC